MLACSSLMSSSIKLTVFTRAGEEMSFRAGQLPGRMKSVLKDFEKAGGSFVATNFLDMKNVSKHFEKLSKQPSRSL